MLPRDVCQLIFNELVKSQSLLESSLEAFRDCDLQVIVCCISEKSNGSIISLVLYGYFLNFFLVD